jgi:hypothetical protein
MATSSHKDQVQENFVPWSHGKQRPHRGIKNCESVKAEFLDLYFQSNLEEARAAIEKLHGLKARCVGNGNSRIKH